MSREIGEQIPVSIPTAIPIEEVVLKEDGEKGDIWINVRTLVRNCLNCLSTEEKISISPMDVAPVIMEEMQLISDWIHQASHNTRRVVYYVTEKRSFSRCFPHALPKGYKTAKQKHELQLTNETLLEVMGALGEQIKIFDIMLKGEERPVLIITHQSIDLLSEYSFPSLKLLESHTGKIKSKTYWNSKLSGKNTDVMPFNALTLQVFGDGESFAAFPRKLKMEVVNLATIAGWSPITSKTKIESDLNKLQDKVGMQMLRDMLRNKPR